MCGPFSASASTSAATPAPPPPFADVVIRCADGCTLFAHQCVLASRPSRDHALVLQFMYQGFVPRLAQRMSQRRCTDALTCRLVSSLSFSFVSSPSSRSQHQPVMATLAQLQSLLAPHMHVCIQAHAMQQANRAVGCGSDEQGCPSKRCPHLTSALKMAAATTAEAAASFKQQLVAREGRRRWWRTTQHSIRAVTVAHSSSVVCCLFLSLLALFTHTASHPSLPPLQHYYFDGPRSFCTASSSSASRVRQCEGDAMGEDASGQHQEAGGSVRGERAATVGAR